MEFKAHVNAVGGGGAEGRSLREKVVGGVQEVVGKGGKRDF